MNIFDRAKSLAYKATTAIMGYDAEWYDDDSEETFTARVHFKYPTPKEELLPSDIYYMPTEPIMEYFEGSFPNLKQKVDENSNQEVFIDGIGNFYVRSIIRKYDGDTLVAILTPAE